MILGPGLIGNKILTCGSLTKVQEIVVRSLAFSLQAFFVCESPGDGEICLTAKAEQMSWGCCRHSRNSDIMNMTQGGSWQVGMAAVHSKVLKLFHK